MDDICVLGGGVTGLSCAWKISDKVKVNVFERDGVVGGISSCFKYKGMKLDYGPHKIYTQNRKLLGEVLSLFSPEEIFKIEKVSRIRLRGNFYSFPVRIGELLLKLNPGTTAKIGMSYAGSMFLGKKREGNYEEYIRSRFGSGLYELVFGPLASKVWGSPDKLSDELAKTRVAMPSLLDLMKRTLLGDAGKPEVSAKFFYYPKKGISEVSEKMKEKVLNNRGSISLNSEVRSIKVEKNKMKTVIVGKKEIPCSKLISTIPLEEMVKLLSPDAPENVIKSSEKLKHRNLILTVLVVNKLRIFDDNWLFFPEKKYVFNRVYEQKGFSPFMVPETKTALCCEITCESESEMWKKGDDEIIELAATQLEEIGLIKREEIVDSTVSRVEKAYPKYLIDYRKNVDTVLDYIDTIENIYTIGRNGMFNYVGLMDCIDMGFQTADHILKNETRDKWKENRERFREYVTVD